MNRKGPHRTNEALLKQCTSLSMLLTEAERYIDVNTLGRSNMQKIITKEAAQLECYWDREREKEGLSE